MPGGNKRVSLGYQKDNKRISLKHFAPCNPLCESKYRPTFEQKFLQNCFLFFFRVFDEFSNDIQVDRLCTCGSLVIDVLKFVELMESQKFSFSIFPVLKGLN